MRTRKIRLLKQYLRHEPGTVHEWGRGLAETLVSNGRAEFVVDAPPKRGPGRPRKHPRKDET